MESKWIKVEDGLPELSAEGFAHEVIVCILMHGMVDMTTGCYIPNKGWLDRDSGYINVTHWMEYPAAPGEDGRHQSSSYWVDPKIGKYVIKQFDTLQEFKDNPKNRRGVDGRANDGHFPEGSFRDEAQGTKEALDAIHKGIEKHFYDMTKNVLPLGVPPEKRIPMDYGTPGDDEGEQLMKFIDAEYDRCMSQQCPISPESLVAIKKIGDDINSYVFRLHMDNGSFEQELLASVNCWNGACPRKTVCWRFQRPLTKYRWMRYNPKSFDNCRLFIAIPEDVPSGDTGVKSEEGQDE
jgi:hypothetical protein